MAQGSRSLFRKRFFLLCFRFWLLLDNADFFFPPFFFGQTWHRKPNLKVWGINDYYVLLQRFRTHPDNQRNKLERWWIQFFFLRSTQEQNFFFSTPKKSKLINKPLLDVHNLRLKVLLVFFPFLSPFFENLILYCSKTCFFSLTSKKKPEFCQIPNLRIKKLSIKSSDKKTHI